MAGLALFACALRDGWGTTTNSRMGLRPIPLSVGAPGPGEPDGYA